MNTVPEPQIPEYTVDRCFNYSPLIDARVSEHIAVTGKGTLNGNGQARWEWKRCQQEAAETLYRQAVENVPVEQRVFATEEAALRPSCIQFLNCGTVLPEDFRIEDSPRRTIHPVCCENVIVRRVHVYTHGHNTDGLNPDSCRNVVTGESDFDTGYDCSGMIANTNAAD